MAVEQDELTLPSYQDPIVNVHCCHTQSTCYSGISSYPNFSAWTQPSEQHEYQFHRTGYRGIVSQNIIFSSYDYDILCADLLHHHGHFLTCRQHYNSQTPGFIMQIPSLLLGASKTFPTYFPALNCNALPPDCFELLVPSSPSCWPLLIP